MIPIESAFEGIKGQDRIVNILIMAAKSWQNGGEFFSPLISGVAGLGKSRILSAYKLALEIAAKNSGRPLEVVYLSSPQNIRLLGHEYQELREKLYSVRNLFVICDEAHEFSDRKTVQSDRFYRFIKTALDANGYDENGYKIIQFDDDTLIRVNKKEIGFAFATNYVERLADGPALKSRFTELALDALTPESQEEILRSMLDKAKLAVEESAIKVLSSTGRNNARAFEKLVDYLKMSNQAAGKRQGTVNRAQILDAIRAKKLYPCGLRQSEMKILEVCQDIRGFKQNALAMLTGRELKETRDSIYFLQSKGFINVKTSNITTNRLGVQFLETCRIENFIW